MDTYFAPAERLSREQLSEEIALVGRDPVIRGLMQSDAGLLAVIDDHRQILALNDALLKISGCQNPDEVIGLRPGELIHCVHAHAAPAGCGTTPYCSTCGAVVAVMASLANETTEERLCAVKVHKNDRDLELSFQVRSIPIPIESHRILLVFLRDVTAEQTLAALEKVFFHDLNNTLHTLLTATQLLKAEEFDQEMLDQVSRLVRRIKKETDIQRLLAGRKDGRYDPHYEKVPVTYVISELQSLFSNHPVAAGKRFCVNPPDQQRALSTDSLLVIRVLTNMLINAFEASGEHGEVRLWVDYTDTSVTFCVWNAGVIPPDVQLRIFQRYFSTKKGIERGLGTYSMKLLGENLLGGQVRFTSNEKEGTVFRLTL